MYTHWVNTELIVWWEDSIFGQWRLQAEPQVQLIQNSGQIVVNTSVIPVLFYILPNLGIPSSLSCLLFRSLFLPHNSSQGLPRDLFSSLPRKHLGSITNPVSVKLRLTLALCALCKWHASLGSQLLAQIPPPGGSREPQRAPYFWKVPEYSSASGRKLAPKCASSDSRLSCCARSNTSIE